MAAPVALTLAGVSLPEPSVLPTLAFFGWAYVLSRVVIDVPGFLGLFGGETDEDEGAGPADAAWVREGRRALEASDPWRAVEAFEAAEAARPGRAETAAGLGEAYRRCGRVADALWVLEDAERLNAGDPALHLEFARALALAGEKVRAVEQLELALAVDPGRAASLADDPTLALLIGHASSGIVRRRNGRA